MDLQDLLNQDEQGEQPKGPSPLKTLEPDLKFFSESIREVAVEIMVEAISAYPIFIAHQHEVSVGELILDKKDLDTDWSINASTIEEFMEKGIIDRKKKDLFTKSYKSAHEFMCLFVVVPEGANFVYYPYT